jgi:hypothetical protein
LQCRSVSLVQDQQRQRSSKRVSSRARKARIGVGFLLQGAPSLLATTVRLHHRSAGNVTSARIVNGYVEIPIERAATLRQTSRGFLPWRLSDDGPGASGSARDGAVIRNDVRGCAVLLYQLVGAAEERRRHVETQRLRGLELDELHSGRGEAENYDIRTNAADLCYATGREVVVHRSTVADNAAKWKAGAERAKGDATWDRLLCGFRPWEEMAPWRWRASNSRCASRRLAAMSF